LAGGVGMRGQLIITYTEQNGPTCPCVGVNFL
jgi:hypothetical protein